MSIIQHRSEILFLYDCTQCNPNGDPNNGNQPRIDDETQHCLVTDVRLKRTIRDFLIQAGHNGVDSDSDVFVRDFDGIPTTGQKRSESYKDRAEFTSKFIDVRLFGGVSAPKDKKKVFNLTGPVQFGMGTSLHPVKTNFLKGTGAFATKEGSIQRTFREEYNITYGLIGFHGVINEQAAKSTQLTDQDVEAMMTAIWDGTKGLLSRSKKGHMPRLMVKINYSKPMFFIGDLVQRIRMDFQNGKSPDTLTDVADYILNVDNLNAVLKQYADNIDSIEIKQDDRLQLSAPISKD